MYHKYLKLNVHIKKQFFPIEVLTIEEKPFVYARKVDDETECNSAEEILCPHYNASEDAGR